MSDASAVNVSETNEPEGVSEALQALLADVEKMSAGAVGAIDAASSIEALEELRLRFLGKKGAFAELNRRFGSLPAEEKPAAGKELNERKSRIVAAEKAARTRLERERIDQRLRSEAIDVTLPGTAPGGGHLHPIVQVRREIERVFTGMGFQITESPEVESEWVNFDALNFLPDHPARDMQDTFFTDRGHVLRTHTSPNQIRAMSATKPPLAVISSGKVYRCDADATHSPMFFQMEGFVVDQGVSMAHLKGTLNEFVHALFGPGTETRFRPSFFPFTEPSAEVDIRCDWLSAGWMEILGCGMIHPAVLTNCGIDPEKWSGFAFGLGLDRIAMLKYGIDDIRHLYENDARFLSQF